VLVVGLQSAQQNYHYTAQNKPDQDLFRHYRFFVLAKHLFKASQEGFSFL
jgi:hypothetical protein